MKARLRTLTMALGSLGVTIGLVGLWIINRLLWLVGLSTVTSDAPNAPKGLLELLTAIASMPGWALGVLALAAIGVQVWLAYNVLAQLDDNKSALWEASSVKQDFARLNMVVSSESHGVKSKLDALTANVAEVHREMDRNRSMQFVANQNLLLWTILAERLYEKASKLELSPGQADPKVGWAEWEHLYEIWVLEFEQWVALFNVDPLGAAVQERFSSMAGSHEKQRLLETHKISSERLQLYFKFHEKRKALANFHSMVLKKAYPDPTLFTKDQA